MFKRTGELEKKYIERYGLTRYLLVGYIEKGLVRCYTTAKGHYRVEEEDVRRVLGIKEDSE